MKMCQPHWDKLRAAVEARGMTHLVPKSGQIALQNAVLELEGREQEAGFDPLMGANYMIWGKATELGGLYLYGQDADGNEYCPVCEAMKHGPVEPATQAEIESYWIDGPVEAMLTEARQRGLLADSGPCGPTGD